MSSFHVEVFQPSFPDGYRLFFGVDDDEDKESDWKEVGDAAVEMGFAHVKASGYDIDKVHLGVSAIHKEEDCPGHTKGTP